MTKLLVFMVLCGTGDTSYQRRVERAKEEILAEKFSDDAESLILGKMFIDSLSAGEALRLAKKIGRDRNKVPVYTGHVCNGYCCQPRSRYGYRYRSRYRTNNAMRQRNYITRGIFRSYYGRRGWYY